MKKTPYAEEVREGFILPDTNSYTYACKKKSEMVLRGRVEAAFCKQLVFITLTYDRKHLPTTYKDVESLPIFHVRETRKRIEKVDSQLFKIKISENGKVKKTRSFYSDWYDLALTRYSDYDCSISQQFEYVPIPETNTCYIDPECFDGKKWITKKSRPLDLSKNQFRKYEVMTEQDFKNAKFNWTHSDSKQKDHFGLLVPEHLYEFLQLMRDAVRVHYNNKKLHLRFLANGEYGQTEGCTHRPHYHILIFSNFVDFDWDAHMRLFWNKARILQCDVIDSSNCVAVKRITAYVYAHTAKVDDGNQYQNEMSPTFRTMSTYEGGIGCQLTDPKKFKDLPLNCQSLFLRSLSFSLSAWKGKDSLKFTTTDHKGNLYEYEVPRYYKDKRLNYQNLDTRSYYTALYRGVVSLCESFMYYCNIYRNDFDLLTVFYNIGSCASPLDVLTFFYINNYKKFQKNFADINVFRNIALSFLEGLHIADNVAREVFRSRYANRKQNQKYKLAARGFDEL